MDAPASVIEIRRPAAPFEMPAVLIEEVFSFLRETRGALTWTVREMADSLKISQSMARQVIGILRLQGYVKEATDLDKNAWLTTVAGETVSGSVAPRFNRERVNDAVSALKDRIKTTRNKGTVERDGNDGFRVAEAVAFGDFLSDRTKVQAAEVGIRLERAGQKTGDEGSDADSSRRAEIAFLKRLRGGSARIKLRSYQPWMSSRSHIRLL
jgi:hypothetical protein